jgi:hypothetical protein
MACIAKLKGWWEEWDLGDIVGWAERSDTHQRRCVWRWVSLRSTHPTARHCE